MVNESVYKEAVPACGLPASILKKKGKTTICTSTALGAWTSLPWSGHLGTDPQHAWGDAGLQSCSLLRTQWLNRSLSSQRGQCSVTFKSPFEGFVCCLSLLNKLKLHKIP